GRRSGGFMKHRVVLLGLALLLLANCAGEAQLRYAEELCTFRERKDPEIVAYTDPKDQSLLGEPDAEVYKDVSGQIASAVATAREPVYRYEERRDCYDKAGDFYYPCIQKFEVELGQVKAVGRALTLEKAETLARNLCQRKVDD